MAMPERLRIVGGAVHDPANNVDGEVRDVCIEDGRIVANLPSGAPTLDVPGMATEAFKKVGDDFKNFATGGLVGLFAVETGDKSETACPALVTVIYHAPKDPAAFESYYPTHLKIVSDGQSEIGFDRADLTKFVANLDGSAPAEYRQAELCFPSMDALKKGTATPAFKKVGGDFKNFATGGLTGMIGEQK